MTDLLKNKLWLWSTAGLSLACALGYVGWLMTHQPQPPYSESHPHPKRTFVPERVSGDDQVEAEVTSAKGLEITIKSTVGAAIVFFEPDSFSEQAELSILAELQPISTFFGSAKAGLNLPDEAIELSQTISVKALAGNSSALQRVRISLPFNDAVPPNELGDYDIFAVFSYPLTEGGVTTTSLAKKAIQYQPRGLVTFWAQGVPLEAVVIGVPK